MSNLPKRLRAFQMYPEEVMYEAADALEAKNAEIERLKAGCDRLHGYIAEKDAEIERFEGALARADARCVKLTSRIAELEAESEDYRQGFIRVGCENAKQKAVVDAAREYEKMFARSRTKPYGISNELQALFDALAALEGGGE